MELHGENCLVTLHCNGQKVDNRGSQAGVQEALPDKPSLQREFSCPWPSVKHQEHVCNPSKKISCSQIPQEVIDRIVESLVDNNGCDDQQIGEQYNDADCQAKGNHQDILGSPFME